MAVVARLETVLAMNTARFEAGAVRARRSLSELTGATTAVKIGITKLIGGLTAFEIATHAFSAAAEQERALSRLETVLSHTGDRIGITTEMVQGLAAEIQRTTEFEDDAVILAAANLARFGNVTEDNFKRALQAGADLAAFTNGDLVQSTNQLATALARPERAYKSLLNAGIVFTRSEKEQIAALVEVGNTAAAQEIIFRRLAETTGGVAEDSVRSLGGQWAQLKNTFNEAAEALGSFVRGPLQQFMDVVKELTKISTGQNIDEYNETIKQARKLQEATQKRLFSRSRGLATNQFRDNLLGPLYEMRDKLNKLPLRGEAQQVELQFLEGMIGQIRSYFGGTQLPPNALGNAIDSGAAFRGAPTLLERLLGRSKPSSPVAEEVGIARAIFGSRRTFRPPPGLNFEGFRERPQNDGALPGAAVRGSAEAANIEALTRTAVTNPLNAIKAATQGTVEELKKIDDRLKNQENLELVNIA